MILFSKKRLTRFINPPTTLNISSQTGALQLTQQPVTLLFTLSLHALGSDNLFLFFSGG